jgi:hypothetical protein
VDLLGAILVADALAHARGRDQHLERGHAALAVGARHEPLRDHRLQDARELDAHLLLLVGREHRDDAVDRLGGVERVQRAHHEMAGLGRRERRLDRLEVAHLTDEDHVGILAQRRAQRVGEALRVDADLALVHDRAAIADQELDRILDRHDVTGAIAVDVVDHRGERGRLARARRARDEHEPAMLHRDVLDHLRQHQLIDRLDAERDRAEHDADGAALLEHVDAEAAEPGDAVGEVDFARVVEALLLDRVHDPERHLLDVLGREPLAALERHERAVDAEHRRQSRLQVDVRGPALEGDLQDLVELHRVLSPLRRCAMLGFDRSRARLESGRCRTAAAR